MRVVVRQGFYCNDIITNAHVVYESIRSDHLPVVFELDLQLAPDVQPGACHGNAGRIDWSRGNLQLWS